MSDEYDSPWKEILDGYFESFMAMFFPLAHAEIDWAQGYETLDKELEKIVRDAELGRRLADKLVKVVDKTQKSDMLVLIHTEVQSQVDASFAKRMYVYNFRIFDRYNTPVVSLAVLGDENEGWHPDHYGFTRWGCSLDFRFPAIKLTDFKSRWEELEESDNPFATVVMAHLKALETKKDPFDRKAWKMRLIRRMYEQGYTRQVILDLFRFIDWVMALPEELEEQFENELESFEEEKKMPYVTSIERRGIKKGIQEGRQEGRQEGIQEGIQEGMQKGMQKGRQQEAQTTLLRILNRRFGQVPAEVEARINNAELEQVEAWIDSAIDSSGLAGVFSE